MRVTLNRFVSSADDSLSMLCINGKFSAFIIEDEYRQQKVKGETRIPAGIYKLVLVDSPKFSPIYGHKMIMLEAVPGFTGILIHPGVSQKDTEGCLCPGNVARFNPMGESRLEESKAAYFRIYPIIAQAIQTEGAEIEVIDSDL
ncbi:DUF5675 family protein [Zoogloea sp.]|uniref:DUF5675 family protein n=1 Tax=Zoogloea sp. TaxID=49181 RepID=UPI001415B2DD|nr:MAG: hypothetical protein F9K15_12740 [Zoogloea sp.]